MKRRIEDEKEELQQTINRFPFILFLMVMMMIMINVENEYDGDDDGGSNSREGGAAADYQHVPLLVIFSPKIEVHNRVGVRPSTGSPC